MSSILKALRKLEEERAIRREGSLDIARDILRRPASRRRRSAWRTWLVAALAVLLLAAAGWGLASLLTPAPMVAQEPVPSPPATVPLPVAIAPLQGAAGEIGGRLAAVQAEPEILLERIAEEPVPLASASPRRSPPPLSRPPRPAAAPVLLPPAAPPVAAAAPVAPTPSAPASLPTQKAVVEATGLTVSAIYFQENPEARLAVVNDLPVMLGTDIDGATVAEILPDHVRFTRAGRSFEVALEP